MRKTTQHAPQKSDAEKDRIIAKAFWNMSELYNFKKTEIAVLLGMNSQNPRNSIKSYQEKLTLPNNLDVKPRVGNLIAIHKCLRILFPMNPEVRYQWLREKRDLFEGKSALEFITEDPDVSYDKLFLVRRIMDQLRGL